MIADTFMILIPSIVVAPNLLDVPRQLGIKSMNATQIMKIRHGKGLLSVPRT